MASEQVSEHLLTTRSLPSLARIVNGSLVEISGNPATEFVMVTLPAETLNDINAPPVLRTKPAMVKQVLSAAETGRKPLMVRLTPPPYLREELPGENGGPP